MFLILHGQTEWNRDGRLQGGHDSPLTDEGCRQARRSGDILRAHLTGTARIIASPLGRTQTTARIVADCLGLSHDAIETDARLAELALGDWEGRTRAEILSAWPETTDANRAWLFTAPNGESYDTIHARLSDWYASLDAHDNIVAVSHGLASRVLRGIHRKLHKDVAVELAIARDAPFHLSAAGTDDLLEPR